MEVRKIMIPLSKLISCDPKDDIQTAINKMAEFDVNSIAIMKDSKVVGLVTTNDVLDALAKFKAEALGNPLDGIMSVTLISVHEKEQVNNTIIKMKEAQTHHMLVINDQGEFTGLISSYDIVRERALDIRAHPWPRS